MKKFLRCFCPCRDFLSILQSWSCHVITVSLLVVDTYRFYYNYNGMLRHSLETLEGEQDFIFFIEPSYPEILPFLFICRDFFYFCPFNHRRARLQAQGIAMSACTRLKLKKETKSLQIKQNSLKLQEFLIMKNYRITLTRGNYETSGRQITFIVSVSIKCQM